MDGVQVGGDHYTKMAMEPIEYINANNLPFCEGNVVKYISRYKDKNGKKDLAKCVHYVLLTMKREYGLLDSVIEGIINDLGKGSSYVREQEV